jgi:predicted RNase H-like HicB family nuclease
LTNRDPAQTMHLGGVYMIQHYVVVLAPQGAGGWCAHFPDIPGCRAMGDGIEQAIENSSREAMLRIERTHELPVPRSQSEIRADDVWARQRGIDWSEAVFAQAPLGVQG